MPVGRSKKSGDTMASARRRIIKRKAKYGGHEASDVKRLKELKQENSPRMSLQKSSNARWTPESGGTPGHHMCGLPIRRACEAIGLVRGPGVMHR